MLAESHKLYMAANTFWSELIANEADVAELASLSRADM